MPFCLEFRRVLFRSEEHTSELQSHDNLVCRLPLEKKTTTPAAPPVSAAVGKRLPCTRPTSRRQAGRLAGVASRWRVRAVASCGRRRVFFFNEPAPTDRHAMPLRGNLGI